MARYFERLSLFFSLLLKGALDMTGANSKFALQHRPGGLSVQPRRDRMQPLFG